MKLKKILLLFLLVLLPLSLAACDDEIDKYEEVDFDEAFNDKVICNMQDGNSKNLKLKTFYDETFNPIYDTYLSFEFYPKKNYKHHHFDTAICTVFFEENRAFDNFVIIATIEDLVIEYETVIEEITKEDGTIEKVEKQVEKSRHTEVIQLNEIEVLRGNGDKGEDLTINLDYDIKDYSSSTCFKFTIYEADGVTPYSGVWALDEFYIAVYNDEE